MNKQELAKDYVLSHQDTMHYFIPPEIYEVIKKWPGDVMLLSYPMVLKNYREFKAELKLLTQQPEKELIAKYTQKYIEKQNANYSKTKSGKEREEEDRYLSDRLNNWHPKAKSSIYLRNKLLEYLEQNKSFWGYEDRKVYVYTQADAKLDIEKDKKLLKEKVARLEGEYLMIKNYEKLVIGYEKQLLRDLESL